MRKVTVREVLKIKAAARKVVKYQNTRSQGTKKLGRKSEALEISPTHLSRYKKVNYPAESTSLN